MMVADLEHANSRVATVERRNVCSFRHALSMKNVSFVYLPQELLRAEIEAMKSGHEGTAR